MQSEHAGAPNVDHPFYEVGLAHDMNVKHRKTMEDAHVVEVPFMGEANAGFFAVYDGHGGSAVAEEVAKTFHKLLESEIRSKTTADYMECFQISYSKMDEGLTGAHSSNQGSTSVTCVVRKEGGVGWTLSIANAGDARAILCRNGYAVRLTQDHKPTEEKEQKRITDLGGFVKDGRVNGILGVARAFGDHSFKKYVTSAPFYIDVDLREPTQSKSGDSILIIGCDGVWDVLEDQQALDTVRGEWKILGAKKDNMPSVPNVYKDQAADRKDARTLWTGADDHAAAKQALDR